jgi:hypothetical protein
VQHTATTNKEPLIWELKVVNEKLPYMSCILKQLPRVLSNHDIEPVVQAGISRTKSNFKETQMMVQ